MLRALRGGGQALITAGLVVLLFVVYLLFWTDLENARTQSRLGADLRRQWRPPAAATPAASSIDEPTVRTVAARTKVPAPQVRPPAVGEGLAFIDIPRIGLTRLIVEGVDPPQLDEGPGHVPGSAMPGELGNFAVSGHRTTYGAPFNRLDEVRDNDHVVIETRDAFATYRVVGEESVDPSDGIVVTADTPPIGAQPRTAVRLLTLTTCTPKYSAAQRFVLRAVLERIDPKTGLTRAPHQLPPALQPGAV